MERAKLLLDTTRAIMGRAKPLLDRTREGAVALDVDGMQRGF